LLDIAKLFSKLATYESEYAKSLSKVCSSTRTPFEMGTTGEALEGVYSNLEKTAQVHHKLSEAYNNDLALLIQKWVKEKGGHRKKLIANGTQFSADYAEAISSLKKAKLAYDAKCKAAEQALQIHQKGKTDGTTKPKDLIKLQQKVVKCNDSQQLALKDYQKAIVRANEAQTRYYNSDMPKLLAEFEALEYERLTHLKDVFDRYGEIQNQLPSHHSTISKTLVAYAKRIDEESDIRLFIQDHQTKVKVPPTIEFEPYQSDCINAISMSSLASTGPTIVQTSPLMQFGETGTVSDKPITAVNGASTETSAEPATDKISVLENQVNEMKEVLKAESKSKKGLEKLVKFYAGDFSAQEKAKGELEEQKKKILQLKAKRIELEKELNELKGIAPPEIESPRSEESKPVKKKVLALFDYIATNETELSFKEGDVLSIREQDDSGWWFATLGTQSGFIPNNYVSVVD